uniref:AT hook containing transcription factor 1 n=1 Tax=Denticeps clupeoides TaxID=299321 RepID=A0AAY4A6S7_9TELE
MRDLVAQVTSSLLHFPEVTVDALGEDEVTLDSVLHGKFTVGRNGLAWLACGPQLEVVHSVTGERFSAYCFSSVSENPPTVLAVRDFSWLKRTGLLVGLEEAEGSMLCLYDLGISRVVKAVVIPGRITAVEPLVSYGGASTSTQHLHQSLRWFFGVAAVVTDIGHVLLVDLCLDDLSCSQTELEASGLEIVNKSPSDIPRLREGVTRQGRHLCLQLSSPTGTGVTALQYVSRTNQLAVGFSDGYLQLWNMKTLKKEYHSQLEGGRVPVYAFTFQEPENDPRNCCYLWAVQSAQDHEGDVVSLHLLQLAFGERKCLHSGKILYEGLEYCEERYSQDLNGTAIPLRAQATNTRLLSCQTIEKFRHHPDRDDSMNEVASPDTSVSIFSWQVKSYGQGKPSTYIGAVLILLSGLWTLCLLNSGIVHLTCSGYQKETLSYLKKSGPSLSESISNGYSRCLMSGLLSTRLADVQPSNLSQVQQLDAILSTAVESSSLGLITGCIKQCKTEDQPGSVVNLRYILEWAWDKVVQAKEELDSILFESEKLTFGPKKKKPKLFFFFFFFVCLGAPLFDSTSNFTDPQTLQLLQHSQLLLSNLSTIFTCLLNEAQELTHKGLVGLFNKNLVSALIAQYAQVVLWFCRTGLLPEGSDDDALQLSRPFYSYVVIKNYYSGRREELQRLSKGKWCSDCLMVDGLVAQCSQRLGDLWKRDEGGTGQYPPSSLHALLDIYLLENVEESDKHAVVIYLLLDVMYSFPNKSGASVESFPTAFAIPIGLVKLVQGLWLLDHRDHENSLELLLHPATSHSMWSWQHDRVLQALMCQGQHKLALRYMHVMKPPTSSTSQAKLSLLVLLHNRCMVEAWTLLRQHSNKLNMEELLHFLFETCQELDLIKELLKLPLGMAEQVWELFLLYSIPDVMFTNYINYLFIPAKVIVTVMASVLKQNDRDPKLKERSNTRNSILDQYGKVLPRAQWKLATERAKPYSHPSTIFKKVSRPQPLSTLPKRSATENVMTRSTFINNVLSKIEEVWVGKDKPKSSTFNCSTVPEVLVPSPPRPSMEVPEAFVSTPITNSKRMSRLLDRVVHPSSQNSPEAAGPLSQTPTRTPYLWPASKSLSKAPELSLLQTPQVVKRARALAASGTSAFSSFTPHSILRSSQRTTPVATPSASPGRSVTPSLRPKESRITFIEEASSPGPEPPKGQVHWSNGGVADGEVSLLKRSGKGSWSLHQSREEEDEQEPSLTLAPQTQKSILEENESQSGSSVQDVSLVLPTLVQRPSLGHDVSVASVDQSGNTDVEFHDAPEPEDSELHPTLMRGELQPNSVPGEPSIEPTVPEISCPAPVVAEQSNHQPELESSNSDEANLERSLEEQEAKACLGRILNVKFFNTFIYFSAVVSLNDSEELSSTASEDQSDAEEEEEEDSGSEVEIIDEVEGNGRQHPELFLEELSPHDQYIQEQATAVLSVVTPETQVLTKEEEGQVMMVTLAGDVNNEHDAVCYTELKPSTTLLVPLELTEDHHLVDGGLTALSTETAEPTGGFSLMLEAEDEDEHGGAMLDPNSQLLIMNIPQEVKHTDDYEQQINTDVVMNPMVQEPQMETVVPTEVLDQDDKGVLGDELEEDCMQEVTPMGAGIPVVPFIARLDDEHLESEAAKPELEPVTLDVNDLKDLPAEIEDTTPTEDRGLVNGISVEVEADLEKRAPDVPVVSEPEVLESSMPSMANESEKPHEDQCLENEQLCAHESDKQDAVNSFHDNQEHPGLENAEGMKAAFQSKSTAQICAEKADLESAIPPVTTRKSSGHKKAVTFPSHVSDAEKVQSDGEAQVPSTPRRVTRSSKQLQDYQVPVTPKRSVRKSEVKASGEEAPAALTNAQIDTKAEPSKRQTPQKATPRKGSRRTRSTIVESEEEEEEAAAAAAVGPLPTEVSGRRSARKTQATDRSGEASEVLAVVPEVKPAAPSSPSRLRKSTRRLSLTLENFPPMDVEVSSLAPVTPPRSRRQTRAGTVEKAKEAPLISDDVQPLGVVRRLTRSQHWNPLEDLEKEKEERPLLDTPVEVGSGMPLTDALMERLKDEAREGNSGPAVTEVIHPRRRKAPVQRAPSPPASVPDVEVTQTEEFKPDTGTDGVQDPPVVRRGSAGRRTRASKVPDPESSPVRDFNFTPQKKTRGNAPTHPHPYTPPNASELPQATKSRTKRSARAKAASALPPPVEIVFLSPIATPEESTSRTQRRVEEQQEDKEKEPSSLRMNLRRKRVMDAIFPKPVTRRRKF